MNPDRPHLSVARRPLRESAHARHHLTAHGSRVPRPVLHCLMLGLSGCLCCPLAAADSAETSLRVEQRFERCEIQAPGGAQTIDAECLSLAVPEDPQTPAGKQIDLRVVKLAATGNQAKPDPFTFLAGGPGQAATESFVTVQSAFARIRQQRDIYLIDQRGTGASHPLQCAADTREQTLAFDADAAERSSRECLASLPADPRWYTTSVAVADLDVVRRQLGLDQWNLYGVSYGTRVGLHYLRRYPDQVRTLILDAVVPPTVSLGANLALDAQRALSLMFQRCATDQLCSESFPNLSERTRELLDELKQTPRSVVFENLGNGHLETLEFTANHLALTLRMMAYVSHGVALLPSMLHQAYAHDNFGPLARQAALQSDQINNAIARGMHHAVTCTEDVPFLTITEQQRADIAATYLGLDSIAALESTCAPWPSGVMDADFKQPVVSDKPVLLLSGEADPITPPIFGDMASETLSHSLHIVNPGQAHVQSWLGCTPSIMARFVATADVDEIDYGCLERLQPPPFFIDANGPGP